MLQSVLIISPSGLVLFSKEFVQSAKSPSILAGVITALSAFSVQRTGVPVRYIELASVSVAISSAVDARCAVFYDVEDGASFGKLLSREILGTFLELYAEELRGSGASLALEQFGDFRAKLGPAIQGIAVPVLDQLSLQRGIEMAMLCRGDSVVHCTSEIDELELMANHHALIAVAGDMMTGQGDSSEVISLTGRRTTTVLYRVQEASFIVVYLNSVSAALCIQHIERTVALLSTALLTSKSLEHPV
mmetsp:Transcript_7438/g.8420  ORF Transcript_7438/g.8420 Transcript_7438/m.8420 type:complete len:247 (+) Transcript_7438:78-818(+)|eukprot:CAMPEP_0205831734 /NCGR_PEP_ID=MMETSP0206-20130828/44963_1 /ASSEMBLY_ACC=CAM_ASM_000279 /TAXON_ID=36767 /ORGANISM="Euplotes focardii, Strain TN1" /LENGTH=246 /DNA_ID=CAMNT_0053136659 /DNA_START=73 /DNA_END=813 /DNA_ORIENTATION=+